MKLDHLSMPTSDKGYRLLDISPDVLLGILKHLNDGIQLSDGSHCRFTQSRIPEDARIAAVWIDKGAITLKLESKEYEPPMRGALIPKLDLVVEHSAQ